MGAAGSVNYATPLTPTELHELSLASGLGNADIRALQQHFFRYCMYIIYIIYDDDDDDDDDDEVSLYT